MNDFIYIQIRKIISKTIIRYAFSGTLSLIVENVAFIYLFSVVGTSARFSNILSVVVALIVNFLTNRYFVFRHSASDEKTHMQFILFALLVIFNVAFGTLVIGALVDRGANAYMSKLIITITIISWTYIINKQYIFRSESKSNHQ